MRALCWEGVGKVAVKNVPDPRIERPHDAIVRVRMSSVCGSDLHVLDGHTPAMRRGDILGHEFIGEVVETGAECKKVKRGDRVVVSSVIACGGCAFCQQGAWSLCDNSNPNPELMETAFGYATAAVYGMSHAYGGFAGSHAQYVRVPFADNGAFKIPDGVRDETAVFLSDAAPTGYMGAEMCGIRPGDTVAVWGCGGVGLMAIKAAYLLGAERVIAIDRFPTRLQLAQDHGRAETINYEDFDVVEALREMTAGRGPDACIDAVGMEAHGVGAEYAYDKVKQALRLETDRPQAIRQAIRACRKGGTVAVVGVYGGLVDKFPLGAAMTKGLTLRLGQQHGPKYIPRLLEHAARGALDPSFLMTHSCGLDQGQHGYDLFRGKRDGCVRVVFEPAA